MAVTKQYYVEAETLEELCAAATSVPMDAKIVGLDSMFSGSATPGERGTYKLRLTFEEPTT